MAITIPSHRLIRGYPLVVLISQENSENAPGLNANEIINKNKLINETVLQQ